MAIALLAHVGREHPARASPQPAAALLLPRYRFREDEVVSAEVVRPLTRDNLRARPVARARAIAIPCECRREPAGGTDAWSSSFASAAAVQHARSLPRGYECVWLAHAASPRL